MPVTLSEVLTFSPLGRASREAFWFSSAAGVVAASAAVAAGRTAVLHSDFIAACAFGVMGVVFAASGAAFLFSAAARRLRDLAHSPVWAFGLLVPVLNLVLVLYLGAAPRARAATESLMTEPSAPCVREALPEQEAPRPESASAAATAPAHRTDAPGAPGEYPETPEGRCRRVYDIARAAAAGECTSVRLQVKVRAVEKLDKMLKKGRISDEDFRCWKREVMSL